MDDDPFYFGQDDAVDDDYLMSLGLLPPPAGQYQGSAFAVYQRRTVASLESLRRQYSSGSGANVHRRMHVYLRSISDAAASTGVQAAPLANESIEPQAPRSSRFRHIMRERLRREHLSQGYADLHALLPPGRASKGAKNIIVGAAADYIRDLEDRKGWLRSRNEELERVAPAGSRCGGDDMVVKVRAEGEYPSKLDVFEVVLQRLKAMEELRVTAIRSCFCAGGMWMDVGVESKISSSDVDKAITSALMELEEIKSGCLQDPTSSNSSFSCQVENGVLTG